MDSKLLHYNALDSACTLEVKEGFWPDLMEGGFLPAYNMTLDLFPVLTFLQTRGIRVDHVALQETKKDILSQAATKQHELNEIVGRELNVNSSQQCQQYFYLELGIPPYFNQGQPTVDDLALQRLARGTAKRPGLRAARLVQDIRGLQKLHGTYLNIEFDPDGRMRCSYNPRGTRFGRLSSSKTIFGTGTNNQNLPQEFKRFLGADPGCVLWEVDKRQAEWVVVAYLSGDANMIAAVESGKDTHIFTAALITGLAEELLKREAKLVGSSSDADWIEEMRKADPELSECISALPRTMSARQCGKKSNHGFNYEEGPDQWAMMNEVERREGVRIHAAYHAGYPGIGIWYNATQRQLQKDRTLMNCFGRKYRFMGSMDKDLYKSAYAFVPQSTVVDSLNMGMVKVYDDDTLTSPTGANIDILAQVHDSILMQVPIEVMRHPNFALIMDKVYDYTSPELEYNGRKFKIATDSKIGLNWGGFNKTANVHGMREVTTHSEILSVLDEYERTTTP